MKQTKPIIFSGVQPSGNLHLGNYLGAIARWVDLQNKHNCIFCVVDYHAITVKQDPNVLDQKVKEVAKVYLASGIDSKKSVIFQQSDIVEHVELTWLLNCASARMSDLEKMTQFKDKVRGKINVSIGLFDYPVLMAADILLYNSDFVPVGEDQKQHIELTRTLARRFNNDYKEVFKIPAPLIGKQGAKILALDDPSKKMSKSAASEMSYIALLDKPEVARRKIMKAVTDSDSKVKYDMTNKPAVSNLLTIYSLLSNISVKDLENKYKDGGYGPFKKDLAEVVASFLTEFQTKYNKLTDAKISKILKAGARKIRPIAQQITREAREAVGIK